MSPTAAEAKQKAAEAKAAANAAAHAATDAAKENAKHAMDVGLGGLKKGLKAAANLEGQLEKTMHVKGLMKFADLAGADPLAFVFCGA